MPVVVATITAAPGRLDAVEAVFREMIPAVHEEDGCELYALHRTEDRLVFVEKWRDADALGAHARGVNAATIGQRLAGMLAGAPEIMMLDAVPAGDPAKGAV